MQISQGENRLSYSSSFIRRRHQQLLNYLTNQMGMDPIVASTLLHLHKPTSLTDTFELFIVNQSNLLNHFFIPGQQPQEEVCRVCDGHKSEHIQSNQIAVRQQWSQEVQLNSQISQDSYQEQKPKKTCQICYIQTLEEDIVKIKGDFHNICSQCMEMYLKQEIGNMRVEGLSCPHCNIPLPTDFIQELVDRPTFNKYRQFLRNLQIHKNPNLKWCPNPKCAIVVNTSPKKKTSKCPKCATLICNKCNRQAHPKSSCQGAFKKEIKDWQNAKDVQKCKACSGLVQKIAGCNHMTCSVCHYEWCWLCGSQFSSTHFSPLNPFGCPGLQDRQRDQFSRGKIVMMRVGILVLMIIGIPVMLPLAMIAVGPVLTIQMLYDCTYPQGCCKKMGIAILGVLLGLIGNPLVWIGCIFYLIPKGILRLCAWQRRRRLQEARRNQFMQERLLGEQVYEQPAIQ